MRKEKPNRIYIFVPRYFEIDGKQVKMSAGRAAAQCAHVAARISELGHKDVSHMTTIILAAASRDHLNQIIRALCLFDIEFAAQCDTFEGSTELSLQAIATLPVTKKQSEIFQFCEMW